MSPIKRYALALLILAAAIGLVMGIEAWRGQAAASSLNTLLEPGDVPVYQDGNLAAVLRASELNDLQTAQFTDSEEGKTQQGWLVRDVLDHYLKTKQWSDAIQVTITSTSRSKTITLNWAEVRNPENWVLFSLSGRGTLKLVSKLPSLDTRAEWIQDVDQIEVIEP